jgi:hypothetical protein
MASEIWSAILSGWPSVTDSEVNKIRFFMDVDAAKIFLLRKLLRTLVVARAAERARGRCNQKCGSIIHRDQHKTIKGSEPTARLLRREERDALRGSPRSFAKNASSE